MAAQIKSRPNKPADGKIIKSNQNRKEDSVQGPHESDHDSSRSVEQLVAKDHRELPKERGRPIGLPYFWARFASPFYHALIGL